MVAQPREAALPSLAMAADVPSQASTEELGHPRRRRRHCHRATRLQRLEAMVPAVQARRSSMGNSCDAELSPREQQESPDAMQHTRHHEAVNQVRLASDAYCSAWQHRSCCEAWPTKIGRLHLWMVLVAELEMAASAHLHLSLSRARLSEASHSQARGAALRPFRRRR